MHWTLEILIVYSSNHVTTHNHDEICIKTEIKLFGHIRKKKLMNGFSSLVSVNQEGRVLPLSLFTCNFWWLSQILGKKFLNTVQSKGKDLIKNKERSKRPRNVCIEKKWEPPSENDVKTKSWTTFWSESSSNKWVCFQEKCKLKIY